MRMSESIITRKYVFTVITVSFNNATTIRQTIESVLSQTHPDIEYLLIDGGSTDGTIDIVKEYGDKISWVSEPDPGLYHAMNKGWKQATGEFLGYLNADDFFDNPDVIASMVNVLRVQPNIWALYGDLAYVKADNPQEIVRYWDAGSYWRFSFFFGWMPPHPTFYLRRSAFTLLGGFRSDSLKSAADYELMLRMLYIHRLPAAYVPKLLVRMRLGGISNQSLKNRVRGMLEDRRAWKVNRKISWFITLLMKPVRKIYQFIYRPKNKIEAANEIAK